MKTQVNPSPWLLSEIEGEYSVRKIFELNTIGIEFLVEVAMNKYLAGVAL